MLRVRGNRDPLSERVVVVSFDASGDAGKTSGRSSSGSWPWDGRLTSISNTAMIGTASFMMRLLEVIVCVIGS